MPLSDHFVAAVLCHYYGLLVEECCKASILDFNKSKQPVTGFIQDWMIDNVVVPAFIGYGLAEEYKYLKSSFRQFLTKRNWSSLLFLLGFQMPSFMRLWVDLWGIWWLLAKWVYAYYFTV
ncbi:2-phytyl-1 4-beta-naphthoquinone methyltransferase chloroplastic, partial [Bienertia sinuspersici]